MTNRTERIHRTTTFAVVERIRSIEPHPDPRIERLEIVELTSGVRLVTGKHYRVGDLGIHIRPGALIPGWLAEQLWLVGRKRAHAWFEVREIPIGISDGIKVNSPATHVLIEADLFGAADELARTVMTLEKQWELFAITEHAVVEASKR